MKKTGFLFLLTLFLLPGCQVQNRNSDELSPAKYSVESAGKFVKMARAAQKGVMPGEEKWQALYATEGYRAFFDTRRDAHEWKEDIREAFAVAFDESLSGKRDSVLAAISMESDIYDFCVVNFYGLKQRLDEVDAFLHQTDFEKLFAKANERSKEFLPERINELNPVFNDFFFVSFDPEARVMGGKIFIDINSFYEEGEQGMIDLIAHELHHCYYGALTDDSYQDTTDPLAISLCDLQSEGMADMINKQQMPLQALGAYPQELVEFYNADYYSTPELLKEMDEIVAAYVNGEIDKSGYREVRNCVHFGGHTGGSYMVFLIRDQLGLQAAIDSCCDMIAFVERYNEAATQSDGYVFSDTFVAHVKEIFGPLMK